LIKSRSLACPKANSPPAEVGLAPTAFPGFFPTPSLSNRTESIIAVETFTGCLTLYGEEEAEETGGRARDAVDDSIGVACDDEITAGTEGDLTIGLRPVNGFPNFSATANFAPDEASELGLELEL
jgi:hypothetical protein